MVPHILYTGNINMNYNLAVLACLTMTINLNTVAALSLVLAIGALAWDHFYRTLQYIKALSNGSSEHNATI